LISIYNFGQDDKSKAKNKEMIKPKAALIEKASPVLGI
jgi:hypothetical protein